MAVPPDETPRLDHSGRPAFGGPRGGLGQRFARSRGGVPGSTPIPRTVGLRLRTSDPRRSAVVAFLDWHSGFDATGVSGQKRSVAHVSASSSACAITRSVASGCLSGGYLWIASSTLTIATIRARASLRRCQLMVADLRSLSVSSCASARSAGRQSFCRQSNLRCRNRRLFQRRRVAECAACRRVLRREIRWERVDGPAGNGIGRASSTRWQPSLGANPGKQPGSTTRSITRANGGMHLFVAGMGHTADRRSLTRTPSIGSKFNGMAAKRGIQRWTAHQPDVGRG